VVPESPRRDTSTQQPSTFPARNYDLRGKAPVLLTKGQRNEINRRARAILAKLSQNEDAILTDEERDVLRQYTGEGGLSSGTSEELTQHYTSYDTIEAIYSAIERTGVPMQNALEPSVGSGNFVGLRPRLNWTTVDIDPTNAQIVKALYPDAAHYHMSFERLKKDGFDLVVSNVPFLETRGADRLSNRPDIKALHDFYFAHALTLVKPGGMVAFITSSLTMDKKGTALRRELMSKADVVGAYRFPRGHFRANAHTDVITDVVFLQRRPDGIAPTPDQETLNHAFITAETNSDGRTLNRYYRLNPENILGRLEEGVDTLHGGRPIFTVEGQADLSRIAIAPRKFENLDTPPRASKQSAALPSHTRANTPPGDLLGFEQWAKKRGFIVRSRYVQTDSRGNSNIASSDGVERNVFIANGAVWRAGSVVFFTDVQGSGKFYEPIRTTLADRVLALQDLAELAQSAQSKNTDHADPLAAAQERVDAYRARFSLHPSRDSPLKSLLAKAEPSMWAELTTLFDENWTPADVFSRQTRFSNSGLFRASKEDPIGIRAKASESARGIIELGKDNTLIAAEEIWSLIAQGYSIIERGADGRAVLQNDILYYSGNVYERAAEAKKAIATATDETLRDQLQRQHDRLEALRPVTKSLEEVSFKGIEDWIAPILQQSGIFAPEKTTDKEGRTVWKFPEDKIIENHLNNYQLVTRRADDNGIPTETNQQFLARMRKAGEHVREFYTNLKAEIRANAAQASRAEEAYNSRYRSYVRPDYARAQYLIQDTLDEMAANSGRTPRQNQIEWMVQAIYEGRGINAHDVGAGKTLSAIGLARALKHRHAANKPLFVVPAKVIHKWERDIRKQFPSAKIVNLGKLDAATRTRKLFELANTEADYVLISHEGFSKIDIPAEAEGRFVEELLREHVDDPAKKGRAAGKLQQKMQTLRDVVQNRPRDDRLTLDKLGIDALFVDEAHNYKNIGVRSELVRYGLGKGFDVKLKSTPVKGPDGRPIMVERENPETGEIERVPVTQYDAALGSARAYDMRFKANYIASRNNGRGVFLLTATPTPNKPIESYTMLRHLSADILADYNIRNDREFSDMFFDLGTVENPQDDRKAMQILVGIRNAQDLRGILNRYVDKLGTDRMPWIKVPSETVVKHYLAQSDPYSLVQSDLDERQKNLKPSREIEEGDDTMAAIYSSARAASVDPRLYGGAHAGVTISARTLDSETDKIEAVIRLVENQHKKDPAAGQLIFLDATGNSSVQRGSLGENLHAELKRELVERAGYKPEQIAIINGQVVTDAKTGKETASGDRDKKKQEIVDAYTSGDILVVIGTTTSMGEGMGLQKRTTDIYNLDLPWTPGAIRQRHGRGVRQGNPYPEVRTHLFLMRGTFDALSYSVIANKRGWNEAMWDKEVQDYISTAEEMAGGAMPAREQILIELESNPAKKAELILRFRHESLRRKVAEAEDVASSFRGRAVKAGLELDNLKAIEKERTAALRNLKPNAKIKDPAKQAEAFERSRNWAEQNLAVTQRRILEVEATQSAAALSIREAEQSASVIAEELASFERAHYEEQSGKIHAKDSKAVIQDYYRALGMAEVEETQTPAQTPTPEEAATYLARVGAESGPSAVSELREAVAAVQSLPATPYLPSFDTLLSAIQRTTPAPTAQRKLLSKSERTAVREQAEGMVMRNPTVPATWKAWAEAQEEGERVWKASSILPQMIKDPQPVDITGMEIRDARDFAAATMFLRDPRIERFFGIYTDSAGRAIGSVRIFSVGSVESVASTPAMFLRDRPENATSLIIGHNHPSGSIKPSEQDLAVTTRAIRALEETTLEITDHVIIDGDKFTSMAGEKLVSFPAKHPRHTPGESRTGATPRALRPGTRAEWERVERDSLTPINKPEAAQRVFDAMRSTQTNRINVLILNRQNKITAALSILANPAQTSLLQIGADLSAEIKSMAARHGGTSLLIDLPFDGPHAEALVKDLQSWAEELELELLDARTTSIPSMNHAGVLKESPASFRVEDHPSAIREDHGIRFAARDRDVGLPGFYSGLNRAVDSFPDGFKASGSEFLRALEGRKNKGAPWKTQEAEESGLADWLAMEEENGRKVTKEDAQNFLQQNGVKIEEVRRGDRLLYPGIWFVENGEVKPYTGQKVNGTDSIAVKAGSEEEALSIAMRYDATDGDGVGDNVYTSADDVPAIHPPRYRNISEEWGEEREVTRGIYESLADGFGEDVEIEQDETGIYIDGERVAVPIEEANSPRVKFEEYAPRGGAYGTYREILLKAPATATPYERYYGPHWSDAPNVLAHILMDERRIPLDVLAKTNPELAAKLRADGKTEARALHMIEGQSDLHQAGAVKGYQSARDYAHADRAYKLFLARMSEKYGDYDFTASMTPEEEAEELRLLAARERADGNSESEDADGVPSLPMRGDAWKRIVIRKMIAEAANGGYDLLTWSSGADRFKKWGSQRVDWKKTTDGAWSINAQEQAGGEHAGQNIEQMARERGKLLEQRGTPVRSKDELRRVLSSIARGDETNVDKLTDRVWGRMQAEGEGTALPRKEFFEFLYDGSFRNEARDIVRRMDKNATIGSTTINLGNYGSSTVHAVPITDAMRSSVEQGQPLYRATESSRPGARRGGISVQQARAAIADVAGKLGFEVRVVENLDALSDADKANIARAMRSQGVSGARGIFMPDGRVILLADNISTPAEAVQTLIHETFERGFANLPKAETTAILNDIFKGSLNRKAIYEQATARVKKNYPNLATTEALQSPEGRAAFMREVLAHIAENRTQMPTLWQRVIRAIQNALIRLTKGTALEGTFGDANTAQIETLIDRALRRGASPEIGSQSAPNFQALGNRGVGTERGAQYSAALSRVQDMLRHGGTEVAADPKWKAELDRLGRDREAALADTRNATDPNGTAYTDMTGEEEWIEEKSEEDRREFIEDDYRAIEEEIEQDAENDTALLQAAATDKKNDEIVGAVADVVESIGADMGTVEVEQHRARSGSTYLTMEAGDADLTIRIADHRQVRGGGRIEGDATTARRAGESDIDVVVSGNKVDVYTREGSRWTYEETASDISSLKDIIESKLDAAETATQDDSDIRFAAQDNSMPDSPESFEARLDDLTQRLQAAKSRAAREVIKRERAEQTIEYLRAQANNIVAAQKGLVAYMRRARLPQVEKANLITRLTDLAKFKTRNALARHCRAAIAEVDRLSAWHEGQEARTQIGELLAANAVKLSRKFPTGTRTPETYITLGKIREIVGMSQAAVDAELAAMDSRANAAGAGNPAYAALSEEDAARQALLQTFGGVMLARQAEAWRTQEDTEAALEELERLVKEGMTAFQAKQAAFRAETEAQRAEAVRIITGGRGLKSQPKRFGQERKNETFLEKLRSFATLHLSWEWLLDYISVNDKSSSQLASGLQVHARDAKQAADAEAAGVQARMDEIKAASERIFGVKGRKLTNRLRENSRVVENTGVFVGGEQLKLSQNEAYHIWQMYFQPQLMEQDKDGNTIMSTLGWTEEVRDQIERFMTPEIKAWAQWQMQEFYEGEYHRINEVFRDLYSADLPHNRNYAPAPREFTSSRDADNLLGHEQRRATVFTGSLFNRITNLRNLKIVDGDQLMMQHVFEMEHFISHGRLMRNLRATIGHQDALTAMEHYFPEGAAKRVRGFMNAFARGGEEKSSALGLIQKMRRNFSQAVISSPTTMLKQFASIPYMLLEIPTGEFAKGSAWIIRQPWKAFGLFRELVNASPTMQDRYGSGWERDFRLAMMRTVPKRLGGIKTIADAAGIFAAVGDKAAAFFGGIPVYRYNLKKNLAAGMAEEAAKAEALKAFENAVERTQQSGRTMQLGEMQRDPIWSLFTMFMTQPTAIFRYTLSAVRNAKAGRMSKRDALRQILIANVLGPAVFGFVAAGMRWGMGGDDDDDDTLTVGGMPKEALLQVLTSPFQGLVGASAIAELIARNVMYGYTAGGGIASDLLPWTSTIDSAASLLARSFKTFEGGDIDPEQAAKALDALLDFAGKATGLPIDPARRSITGAMAAIEGDTDYPIRRMIGFSKYALGEGGNSSSKPKPLRLPKLPSARRPQERR